MKLIVIGSSSKGNGYILKSEKEVLLIEAGVSIKLVKEALNYDLENVVGCLISHAHGDHFGKVKEYINEGINIYLNKETARFHSHRFNIVSTNKLYKIGEFTVMPLNVEHDIPTLAFVIKHPESGTILFCTDTMYFPYKINGLTNILIEANCCDEIINNKLSEGANKSVRDRVLYSHMSIQTLSEMIESTDSTMLNNVVLLHLSDSNSNAEQFKQKVECIVPGKSVWIAEKGLEITLNKTPF